ncbi:hypothetical protein [Pseudoalteromonas sp. NBT06-2]|nr:hypothetical protein [Pseudoalteromonas sp. NBT06-2]
MTDLEFIKQQREFLTFVKENGSFPVQLKTTDFERLLALIEQNN